MCLIVASEQGKLIDLSDLEVAFNNNPDGAGVMWLQEGRVHQLHTVPKTFAEVRDLAMHVVGHPHAMHLRYCTRGKVNQDNCHPFTVLNKDLGDDADLTLMHNGTFSWITFNEDHKKQDWSDTAVFATRIQKNLREHKATAKINLDHIFDEKIVDRFSKRVSTWNKVVFLDDKGRWSYLNKSQGEMKNDMWYSNTYSLKVGYRDKQVAHHGPATSGYTYVSRNRVDTSSSSASTLPPRREESRSSSATVAKVSGKSSFRFQRSASNENYIYLVSSNGFSDEFLAIDPATMKFLQTGKRLGRSERAKLRDWLNNEKKLADLRTEKKYERKVEADAKGRKVATVTPTTTSATNAKKEEKVVEVDLVTNASREYNPLFDTEDTIPLHQLGAYFESTMLDV